ncbi:hypothetical protein BX666DRAFT_2031882 [Dichotomocladium elegans]|nr:hypothetical protein BX666DRAFT_2031882 [Dichotomocladium elegans]
MTTDKDDAFYLLYLQVHNHQLCSSNMSRNKLVAGSLTEADIRNLIQNTVATWRLLQEHQKEKIGHYCRVFDGTNDLIAALGRTVRAGVSGSGCPLSIEGCPPEVVDRMIQRRYTGCISQQEVENALWIYVPWEDYSNEAKQWVATLFGTVGEDDEELRNHHPIQMSARAIVVYHRMLAAKEVWQWMPLMDHLIFAGPITPAMYLEEELWSSDDGHGSVPTPAATPPARFIAAGVAPTSMSATTVGSSSERWASQEKEQQQQQQQANGAVDEGSDPTAYQACFSARTSMSSSSLHNEFPFNNALSNLPQQQPHVADMGTSPSLQYFFPCHFRSLHRLPPPVASSATRALSPIIHLPAIREVSGRAPSAALTLPPIMTRPAQAMDPRNDIKEQMTRRNIPDRSRPTHGYRYYYISNYDNALLIDTGSAPKAPRTRQH